MIHVTGCKYSIYSFLDYKHKLTSSVLTGVLVPQVKKLKKKIKKIFYKIFI